MLERAIRNILVLTLGVVLFHVKDSQAQLQNVASEQLNFQNVTRSKQAQPLAVTDLPWSGTSAKAVVAVDGTHILRLTVDDDELISIDATTPSDSLNLSVNRLTFDENGQPSKREDLFRDKTDGIVDHSVRIPERLYGKGEIYLAINTYAPNTKVSVTATKLTPATDIIEPNSDKHLPTSTANQISGEIDNKPYCVKPSLLASGRVLDVDFYLPAGQSGELSVYDEQGKRIELRYGKTHFQISGLDTSGDQVHSICVLGRDKKAKNRWRLSVVESQRTDTFFETSGSQSLIVNIDQTGVLDVFDEDVYNFAERLNGKAITLEVLSGSKTSICLMHKQKEECFYDRKIKIDSIKVSKHLRLKLKDNQETQSSAYKIHLTEVENDHSKRIFEPNYNASWQASKQTPLRLAGRLDTDSDIDSVNINLGDESQLWRFIILGANISRVEILSNGSPAGIFGKRQDKAVYAKNRLVTPNYYLQAGVATLKISGVEGSYKIIAKPLGAPPAFSEREPNEDIARKVIFGETIKGVISPSDMDKFGFHMAREAGVVLKIDVPAGAKYSGEITTADGTTQTRFSTSIGGQFEKRVNLPAGDQIILLRDSKTSPGEYSLRVGLAKPDDFVNNAEVSMEVVEAPIVKSFSAFSQNASVSLKLKNNRDTAINGRISSFLSQPDISSPDIPVSLAANEEKSVSLSLRFPPDLNAGEFQGFIAVAGADDVALGDTPITIKATSKVIAQNPIIIPPVPLELLGGINVALSSLGASLVSTPMAAVGNDGEYLKSTSKAHSVSNMIDGFGRVNSHRNYQAWLRGELGKGILEPVVKLAGEQAIRIRGVGIATQNNNARQVQAFAIDVSLDQQSWVTVYQGQHQLRPQRQYYVFPDGDVLANFIRFRVLEENTRSEPISLSELEVIAVPGQSSLDNINIALPQNGGLHCCSSAGLSGFYDVIGHTKTSALLVKPKTNPSKLNSVITFRNQLPAQIEAIGLQYHFNAIKKNYVSLPTSAIVYAAKESAGGPFDEIGRFTLPTEIDPQKTYRFELPERVMASAVKVEYEHAADDRLQIPNQVKVYESTETDTYRSVMGLWGEWRTQRYSHNALKLQESAPTEQGIRKLSLDRANNNGLVQFNDREERWAVTAVDGMNTVHVNLNGSAGFAPSIEARDSDNGLVTPLSITPINDSTATKYSYPISEQGTLTLKVSEPQRSTVFLLDQSGSMDKYLPQIRQSIVQFADSIEPGRDVVRFAALGMTWGVDDWVSDPVIIRSALAKYPRDKSSDSESAMVAAAKELTKREGSRAIVLVTDADGVRDPDLLTTLKSSQAKVFVILVPLNESLSGVYKAVHPLALQWAAQSGGEVFPMYQYNDLENGFAKASSRLQGFKKYSISAHGEQRILEPGFLKVNYAAVTELDSPSTDNTLIVFDASGSMLKRLGKQRRITIAKSALKRYIKKLSANGRVGNVGLRTFGGVPDKCTTDLRRPISSFNQDELVNEVDSIKARSNAKTAIAAALFAAKKDFEVTGGKRNILLITDGEETCKGNVLKEIEALARGGIQSKLDVVSFALEPNIDRSTFRHWAQAGGGVYVDAKTEQDLEQALDVHRSRRYTLLSDDVVITVGIVGGDAVKVKAGKYKLKIDGVDQIDVVIKSGELTTISK